MSACRPSEPAMARLPLVLLPGTLCDERVWQPMLARWGKPVPAQVLTPALRGSTTVPAMAAALLDQLPPRFAVMGFSLGGIVALELAAQAPGRVAGLALVATNARPDPPGNAARRHAAVAAAREVGLAHHVQADLWPLYVAARRRDDAGLLDLVVRMAVDAGLGTYGQQAAMAHDRADGLPRLQALAVPALVVGGDEDAINPRDRQQEMADRLPQADWVQLPGVGHFVPLEAPGELASAAGSWIERVHG
ncbi:MAG: alpha/beta fold hydrolase [Comamonadaceae bacterium]|nr:MAG: alpha/beta fold hydrolase [Comamonadaceae bacterium]